MITVKLQDNTEYSFDFQHGKTQLNGLEIESDWIQIDSTKYHVLVNHQSYTIELLGKDELGKNLTISVNGQKQTVTIKDKYDDLLHALGMDKMLSAKNNDVKAPMPGLVLRLMVNEGDTVKKGDGLLVLEAMKMENVIKSSGEGIVKKIHVAPKQTVDKNQLMIVME